MFLFKPGQMQCYILFNIFIYIYKDIQWTFLFDWADESGNPGSVVNKVVPSNNSFVFFQANLHIIHYYSINSFGFLLWNADPLLKQKSWSDLEKIAPVPIALKMWIRPKREKGFEICSKVFYSIMMMMALFSAVASGFEHFEICTPRTDDWKDTDPIRVSDQIPF